MPIVEPLVSLSPTTVGPSGDLSPAADEPGRTDCKIQDNPRVGTGETRQAVDQDALDMLGYLHAISWNDVFGDSTATLGYGGCVNERS